MCVIAMLRALMRMKKLVFVGVLGVILLGWLMDDSTAWAQDPRPTLTPIPTLVPPDTPTPTPKSEPTAQPQAPLTYSGPILKGRVFNLITGEPVSGATVVFTAGGVPVEVVSDENGEYAFPHLGTANGVLNAVPPRGSGLRPVTADVAVRTKGSVETVVNLGVSPNGSGAPPLIPTVQLSPDVVGAGETMTITVLVKNTLPHAISGAVVTNWLPETVVPINIHSSTGNPYFSENLAIAELGTLDAGSGALVEIVAQAAGGHTATSALQGKVSFFYRESAASQALAHGHLNGAAPAVLPVTGVGLPVVGLGLIFVVLIVGWVRRRVGSTLTTS